MHYVLRTVGKMGSGIGKMLLVLILEWRFVVTKKLVLPHLVREATRKQQAPLSAPALAIFHLGPESSKPKMNTITKSLLQALFSTCHGQNLSCHFLAPRERHKQISSSTTTALVGESTRWL